MVLVVGTEVATGPCPGHRIGITILDTEAGSQRYYRLKIELP